MEKPGNVLAKVSVPFQEYPKSLGTVIVNSKEEEDKYLASLPSVADQDKVEEEQKVAEVVARPAKKKVWT